MEKQQDKEHRTYVGEVGSSPNTAAKKTGASATMILFALIAGFAVGLVIWLIFLLSSFLTSLLWDDAAGALRNLLDGTLIGSWWIPLAFCTLGGLIIGLWTKFFGGAPKELGEVLGTVKKTGGYTLERPFASIVGFLLPLVFGGSIGPEAGLTGIIAAGCSKIGDGLRASGLKIQGVADIAVSAALTAVFATPLFGMLAATQDAMPQEQGKDADGRVNPREYDFRRGIKIVLYAVAAIGAMGGMTLATSILGHESGLPHFDGATPVPADYLWFVPCLVVGYLCAFLYYFASFSFARASKSLGDKVVLKPLIAGVVIGAIAIFLPNVLFPGEAQCHELMTSWASMGALALILTGLLKCVATPLCLNFGWRGGHFFPLIFAGISCGYGLAALGGADPMFCVAITTASVVAGVQRKPLVALALLLLCFPISDIFWMGLACIIVAVIPIPKVLLGKDHEEDESGVPAVNGTAGLVDAVDAADTADTADVVDVADTPDPAEAADVVDVADTADPADPADARC